MIPFSGIAYNDGVWTFTWAPAMGTVRVILWGKLLLETTDNEFEYNSALYNNPIEAPPVEVVLDGELALSEDNICYLILQWHRVECRSYEIEYKKNSTWRSMGSVQDDSLITVQTYMTELLYDQEISEWRITAVDENKREGDPLNYSWFVVRPPNPPTGIELSCVGGTLTVE